MEEVFSEEGKIPGAKEPVSIEETEYKEKEKCICKIDGKKIGTGFFCKIEYRGKKIPVLITNYHILDDKFLEGKDKLTIYIKEEYQAISINNKSIIYSSVNTEFDIIIIQIKENEINNYLDIDENIFKNNSENLYKDQHICILHYPNAKKALVSFSEKGIEKINEFDIKHFCNTDKCSSGGPIINNMTHKVMGIHKGSVTDINKICKYNKGTFLKFPLNIMNRNNPNFNSNIKSDKYEFGINKIKSKNKFNLSPNNPVEIICNSLCGIKNLENTGYINSSLQILIHIPEFIEIIMNNRYFENNIIKEIYKLFKQILNGERLIDAESFTRYYNLEHNNSQMESLIFLEDLIREINTLLSYSPRQIYNLFPIKSKMAEEFMKYFKESEEKINYLINDLFYVYFIHEKYCLNCKYISYDFDTSLGLKLNFENIKPGGVIYLSDLFMKNFESRISNKSHIECKKCNNCKITIKNRIVKLPKILIISEQKMYKENAEKIPTRISFPEMIDLRNFVDLNLVKNESTLYEIFGVINNIENTLDKKHYYSEILIKGKWYSFNDACVMEINPKYLSNKILFYKRVNKI